VKYNIQLSLERKVAYTGKYTYKQRIAAAHSPVRVTLHGHVGKHVRDSVVAVVEVDTLESHEDLGANGGVDEEQQEHAHLQARGQRRAGRVAIEEHVKR
jgi:hypothetical protein